MWMRTSKRVRNKTLRPVRMALSLSTVLSERSSERRELIKLSRPTTRSENGSF